MYGFQNTGLAAAITAEKNINSLQILQFYLLEVPQMINLQSGKRRGAHQHPLFEPEKERGRPIKGAWASQHTASHRRQTPPAEHCYWDLKAKA